MLDKKIVTVHGVQRFKGSGLFFAGLHRILEIYVARSASRWHFQAQNRSWNRPRITGRCLVVLFNRVVAPLAPNLKPETRNL